MKKQKKSDSPPSDQGHASDCSGSDLPFTPSPGTEDGFDRVGLAECGPDYDTCFEEFLSSLPDIQASQVRYDSSPPQGKPADEPMELWEDEPRSEGKSQHKRAPESESVQPKPSDFNTPQNISPTDSDKEMLEIMAQAKKHRFIRVKPQHPQGAWNLGIATAKGNVRSENQDCGLCFEIGGLQILLVADGCGGVPYGRLASSLAVTQAARSIVQTVGTGVDWFANHTAEVAAIAFRDAYRRLAQEGRRLNITSSKAGLRTTLIMVVASPHEYGYAHIGDGGGCIVRSSGEVVSFVTPQRPGSGVTNILTGSLGPLLEGQPIIGTLARCPGDFIVVGTDGVFEYVEPSFPLDIVKAAFLFRGDFPKLLYHVLAEMAEQKDENGYIFDDNITVGIMCDRTQPRLSPEFSKFIAGR